MKKKVIFVCLGNICRSPSAEAVFKKIVEQKGDEDNFEIDSAGTDSYHQGEPADVRMKRYAIKRGYNLTSTSRKFNPDIDWDDFDYVIGMDNFNMANLNVMARNADDLKKLYKMTDFAKNYTVNGVPDPYYGSGELFEHVLDILEDASEGLYDFITKK